ncbi:transcriptional regulator PadR-like family protein [Oxobacter pfennigii]|uniref:Transcriptional regulator PadR-like family protein n=1 Tax=Oxobacter pfennigii TaxID=36849 RepID=A0A0P8WM44_9CLOT|nr:DUF4180 domain-containing protein [Oxobacter pfennigii]KPU43564.1 transcriptional regulator PadR-like family protein [Oxobacter pfennigii]
MSIKYAILGILSCGPMTGYDLKKIIQDSPFMHWSGNNNQIYKSLVELLNEGLLTNEVHHQESTPSKKVYTITREGLDELKEWVKSSNEAPEFKKTFLVQLAWSEQLSNDELNTLLTQYEYELKMQILSQQEMRRRGIFSPKRSKREELIWDMIYENIISSYENELKWVKNLRGIMGNEDKEASSMDYTVTVKDGNKYIECASAQTPIQSEQNALDLISACLENQTDMVLIHGDVLSDDFFKLKTGLAGSVLQKFSNYFVRAAVVMTDDQRIKGKFKDFLAESNKGNSFRVFSSKEQAEGWLLNP